MTPSCPRLWEVEAERDGRLDGSDLASALRHRALCKACSNEARALSKIAAQLAALPSPPSDALAVRRARQRLLRDFNAGLLRDPAPGRSRRALTVLGIAAAIAALFGVRRWLDQPPSAAPAVAELPSLLKIAAAPDARFLERLSATDDRVELAQGFASFSVGPHAGKRVLITLPDGELEDLGTVFDVEVRDQCTKRIVVHRGRVAVRLRDRAEFELNAGESWAAEAPTAAEAPSAASAPSAPPLATPSASLVPSSKAKPSMPHPRAAPASAKVNTAAPDTAEDDAYLHIVALLRSGQETEAKQQAREYLARFPAGFRRLEVERVLSP